LSTLWILDTPNSALSLSSRLHAQSNDRLMYATDYRSLRSLLKDIVRTDSKYIVFSWRQPLIDVLSKQSLSRIMNLIPPTRKIFFLVADFASVGNRRFENEAKVSQFADGILVTCKQLLEIYAENMPFGTQIKILYDRIDDSYRSNLLQFIPKKKNQIIWVGNSNWGRRHGFADHKGYYSIVARLEEYCQSIQCPHTYVIVDSSKKFLPNYQVLEAIRESEFLLMPSQSEGTGMPIIEAVSLGTVPLCTPTGVANEILQGSLQELVISRNLQQYIITLHKDRIKSFIDSVELENAFNNHKRRSKNHLDIFLSFSGTRQNFHKVSLCKVSPPLYFLRFIKAKLKLFIS
jgi:hypothetical protein